MGAGRRGMQERGQIAQGDERREVVRLGTDEGEVRSREWAFLGHCPRGLSARERGQHGCGTRVEQGMLLGTDEGEGGEELTVGFLGAFLPSIPGQKASPPVRAHSAPRGKVLG